MFYGITDDDDENSILRIRTQEDIEDAETVKNLKLKRKKIIPDNKFKIKPPSPKIDHTELATNVVDIPVEDLEKFKGNVEDLTKEYIDFLVKDILPHMLAFDAAIDYTKILVKDGLNRSDFDSDTGLLISLKWILHLRIIHFFSSKFELPDTCISRIHDNIAEILKVELSKATQYSNNSVLGLLRSLDPKSLGVASLNSKTKKDTNS